MSEFSDYFKFDANSYWKDTNKLRVKFKNSKKNELTEKPIAIERKVKNKRIAEEFWNSFLNHVSKLIEFTALKAKKIKIKCDKIRTTASIP